MPAGLSPNHFYFTVFSKPSRDFYEQNKHADFMVKHAQTLDLGSTAICEVGVCEISSSVPHIE